MAMRIFSPYQVALGLPGARSFTFAAFIARLPLAMVGLGIVLYVSNNTGSYGYAGFLQAAFAVTSAVAALISSRIADQYGQRAILIPLPIVYSASLVMFVGAVTYDYARWIQVFLIVIAGATFPSFGSFVRTRWVYATREIPELLRSAFAWESILDELVFTVGPLLAASLAFGIALPAPILLGAFLSLAGALYFATLKSSEPPAHGPRLKTSRKSAIAHRGLPALVFTMVGVGVLFGSFDVAVVAFTAAAGSPSSAGLVLAVWALGSMVGGILFGSRHLSVSLPKQVLITSTTMTFIALPIPFITGIPLLTVVAFFSGFAIAPTLISSFSLSERLVPSSLLTEGLTWANSGLAGGFALGASVGGLLVDQRGIGVAFTLGVAGAALSMIMSLISLRSWSLASAGRDLPPPGLALNPDPLPGPTPGAFIDNPPNSGP